MQYANVDPTRNFQQRSIYLPMPPLRLLFSADQHFTLAWIEQDFRARDIYNSGRLGMEGDMSATLSIARRLPLSSGKGSIPQLGYGVYQCPAAKTTATTLHALQTGYRHVDTAGIYRNEHAVVAATSHFLATNPSVSRGDIFISTKLAPALTGYDAAKNAIAQSLSHFRTPLAVEDGRLSSTALRPDGVLAVAWPGDPEFEKVKTENDGLGYIDLYLIHAPSGTLAERNGEWRAMVEAQKRGEIKHLGVSNYGVRHLRELYEFIEGEEAAGRDGGRVEVWQGELHPWLGRADIRRFCEEKGIVIQAYCPIVRGQRFGDPLLKGPKERTGKSEAQILIRWSLQMGLVPLPKSERNERIEENADVFDFELTPEEVKMMDTGKYEPCAWDPTVWQN
ncbi:hypothetical protein TWF696_001298 [Orbilia brochopaga]|uniref:NADP-dependent oxidoreductase domain-containing protein n=1 Tax=Orbilia brochopaga TaxID=3140254 RepID=A0AAV9UAL3_9PEZI